MINICNTEVEGKKLVNFVHPIDYFFSLDEETTQASGLRGERERWL